MPNIRKDRPEAQIVKRSHGVFTIETHCKNDDHYNAMKNIRTLRISGLGKARCDKERLLEIFGFKPAIPIEVQNILDAGTALEGLIIKQLGQKGWDVDWNNDSDSAACATKRYLFPLAGGFATGTPDAIASHSEKTHGIQVLCDAKTMNDNRFTGWTKGKLNYTDPVEERRKHDWWYPQIKRENIKSHTAICFPEYFFQVSAYAMASGLEYGMIAGYNKNNSKTDVELFRISPALVKNVLFRAQIALTAMSTHDISNCAGNCDSCWHKTSCLSLFGVNGIDDLGRAFVEHPPLRENYDPLTVLSGVYDLSDEAGHKIDPPSQHDFDLQFSTKYDDIKHIYVTPKIRTPYEEREAAIDLAERPKCYVSADDLTQWQKLTSDVMLQPSEKLEIDLTTASNTDDATFPMF